jgi:uncharacterized membrane protein YgcG
MRNFPLALSDSDATASLGIVAAIIFILFISTLLFLFCCLPKLASTNSSSPQPAQATSNPAIHVSNRAHDVLVPVYSTSAPPQQQQVQSQRVPNGQLNQAASNASEVVMSAYGPQDRLKAGLNPYEHDGNFSAGAPPREVEGEAYQVLQKRPEGQMTVEFGNNNASPASARPVTAGQQLFGAGGGSPMQLSRELPPLPADGEARNYTVVPPVQLNDAAALKERLRQKLAKVNADLAHSSPSDEALNMYNNFPRPPPARDETPVEYRLQRPAPKGPRTPRESVDEEKLLEEAGGDYTDVRAKPRSVSPQSASSTASVASSKTSSSSARSGKSGGGGGRQHGGGGSSGSSSSKKSSSKPLF